MLKKRMNAPHRHNPSTDSDREARLTELIERLKANREHETEPRSNPAKTRTKKRRSRMTKQGINLNADAKKIKNLVDLYRKHEKLYQETGAASHKKKLDEAKKKIDALKKVLKTDRDKLTTLEKEMDKVMSRPNPKGRKKSVKRRTTTRKSTPAKRAAAKRTPAKRASAKKKVTDSPKVAKTTTRRRRRKSASKRRVGVASRRMATTKRSPARKTTARRRRKSAPKRRRTMARRRNPMPMALGLLRAPQHHNHSMGFYTGHAAAAGFAEQGKASVTTGHKVAIGVGAFAGGLVATNLVASTALKVMKIDSARTNKSGKRYAAEIGGHLIAAIPGIYGLVRTHGDKVNLRCLTAEDPKACAKMETQIRVASMGWLGGVAGAAIARLVMPEAIANSFMGGIMRGTNIGNDAIFAETAKAANSMEGLHGRKKIFLNGLGRNRHFLSGLGKSSSARSHSRRPVRAMGTYFETAMGRYVPDNEPEPSALSGRKRLTLKPRSMRGVSAMGMSRGVSAMGLYTQTSRPDNVKMSRGPEDTLGVRTQPEIISGGAFNYRPGASTDILKELQGIECLDSNELMMEGLDSAALEGTYYIRALPDYARQIAQNNIGVIVGNSQVMQGSMLVQLYTDPLQMVNRTQIGGQPDVPRGAAHTRRFGVFSNGIFNSTLPAVDNGYTFANGNIKI